MVERSLTTLPAHARVIDKLVYNSAQIPLGTDGKVVGTTIEEQTVRLYPFIFPFTSDLSSF